MKGQLQLTTRGSAQTGLQERGGLGPGDSVSPQSNGTGDSSGFLSDT